MTAAGSDFSQGYVFNMNTSGFFLATGVLPTITQTQYMAFTNPLEDLPLTFFPAPGSPACCLGVCPWWLQQRWLSPVYGRCGCSDWWALA